MCFQGRSACIFAVNTLTIPFKVLEKVVFYKKGKRFNQQKFDITVRDLQEKYANKGYLRADITLSYKMQKFYLNVKRASM